MPVPRREDDLLERDDVKAEVHLEPISALGYCRTVSVPAVLLLSRSADEPQSQICNLDDLSPEASVKAGDANGYAAAAPLRLPGNDLDLPAAITPSLPTPQDWGCKMPDRIEIDEWVVVYFGRFGGPHTPQS